MDASTGGRITIFAPSTQLSVTLERTSGTDELHVHPAGQGFWVARLLTVLGEIPLLCTPLGGETGVALRALLGDLPNDGFVACSATNGSYIHDRRAGEREEIALIPSSPLDRHVVDDLVSVTLACGLGSKIAVVCGTNLDANVEPSVFERVCRDLRASGTVIVADLSGAELRSALDGGIGLLKISHEELIDDGWADGEDPKHLVAGMRKVRASGATDVVVSCSDGGALAALGDGWYRVRAPEMSIVEHRGAGDSMTASLAFGRFTGMDDVATLRLAAAAAALNVTRHGLASGHPAAIERLADLVEIEELKA
jgi:1-phosphofructokinase